MKQTTNNRKNVKRHHYSRGQHLGFILALMGRTVAVAASLGALFLAASSASAQSVPLATNRFDGGLGTFNYQQNLVGNGNNIAWSATAHAGGSSGEVGGTFARASVATCALVSDLRTSVVPLSLNEVLSWSGKLVVTDISLNGEIGVGFWNSTNLTTLPPSCLAMRIREPASPGGPFRADMRMASSTAANTVINVPAGVPVTFQVTWQPSGLGDGSGIATLTIATATSTNTVTQGDTFAGTFDMFGLGEIALPAADPTAQCVAYFDDLIYSVPTSGPPQFLGQPTAPPILYSDNSFTMFAVVGGDAPMSFQWKKVVSGVTNDLTGATNSAWTFDSLASGDAGTYFLQASNAYNGGTVTNSASLTFTVQPLTLVPSFAETGGKVAIDVEHYDRNWVVNNAGWLFDTNWPNYSGDGYMAAVCTAAQGNTWNTNPHLDYYVQFAHGGTWYVWVRGADLGNRNVSVGINGSAPATATSIGNSTGAFGSLYSGTWTWCGFYGGNAAHYAAIQISGPGKYILSVFMNNEGFLLDQILLTQDAGYIPGGAETETPAATSLGVKVATPSDTLLVSGSLTNGQSLQGTGPKLVAASVTKGANPISKVDFYAGVYGASSSNLIGTATAVPWQILWTNFALGTNILTSVVTDSGAVTATSSNQVHVILTSSYIQPSTLPLYTNDLTSGPQTFTYITNNGVSRPPYTSDFGWRNTSFSGGTAGEVGGLFMRSQNTAAEFMGVPFDSTVNFYFDGLLVAGTLVITNPTTLGSDGDIRIGYASITNFGSDLALDIRPPGGTISGACRFRIGTAGDIPAPYGTPFSFAVRWLPSPLGDGYLAKTRLVCGASFGSGFAATLYQMNSRAVPSTALNCFGIGAWASSSTTTNAWLINADNLAYVVPPSKLRITRSGSQVTLKWPYSVPGYGLWWTPSLGGTPVWSQTGLPTPLLDASTGSYSVTETPDQPRRFYHLR